ncbi:phosphoribosylanthranilate isomerase [Garciella nitratireducens]|uniref:phosphoribosylanthranilate isomerase n=1 Tax=Garciella nitratireducens TaxID=218205 RepID=UPI000DEBB43A|nr:phosphoribosylanthranilate isomerase [Garciella nitratireducens]RBP46909.1 phosphoribosylanthranilate isomerase [Garciella nitratireducens]
MTKIKICGVTRIEEIDYINKFKPEYIGFIFAKSKRQVSLDTAIRLRHRLSKEIKSVGVFVDQEIEKVEKIAQKVGLDVLQFHGQEDRSYINHFKEYEVWKAILVSNKRELFKMYPYKNIRLLFDSEQGGSGKPFDWNIIKKCHLEKQIILAGGLDCDNVVEAIQKLHPFAVDVSSGVETNGVKDAQKVKKFIKKVREFS